MKSVLFHLPTDLIGLPRLPVFGFGLAVVVAFAVGVWIARRRALRMGLEGERVVDLCLYAMVAGIVGARLTFLLFDWTPDPAGDHFLVQMIAVWTGGLTYQGGLIAALLVVWWYMHTRYWPAGRYLDALAPAVLVGAGIGRVGCYLNGCCWGRIAEAGDPYAVRFPVGSPVYEAHKHLADADPAAWADRIKTLGYPTNEPLPLPVLPTQLMETLGYLVIALVLIGTERAWRDRFDGALMLLGVALYSLFRFTIEFYRDDTPLMSPFGLGGLELRFGQWISLGMVAAVVGLWIWLARRPHPAAASSAPPSDGDPGSGE